MRTQRLRRGAAVVEVSVMMLVTLPLIFYTLFLNDLLKYKLEQQEGIITPAWDFAVIPYQRDDFDRDHAAKSVQRINRLKFADHTVAYDSYDQQHDCNDKTHHQALSAHQCWVTQGASQITCTIDSSVLDPGRSFSTNVTKSTPMWALIYGGRGGFSNCTARLGVYNKFVPQQIFTKAAGSSTPGFGAGDDATKLMRQKKFGDDGNMLTSLHGGDVDPDADDTKGDLGAEDQFFFNPNTEEGKDRHIMLQDTWALTHLEKLEPNTGGIKVLSNPLLSRILPYYIRFGGDATSKAGDFAGKLKDDGWINDQGANLNLGSFGTLSLYPATMDGASDSVVTPPAHFDPDSHVDASGGSEQMQKSMYNQRSTSYFGG